MGPEVAPQAVRAYTVLLARFANRRAFVEPALQKALFGGIGRQGAGARVAVPTLIAMARREDYLSLPAIRTLGQIGDPRARDVLHTLRLRSSNPDFQAAAAAALRQIETVGAAR